jgi:hypothetical protein
MKRKLIAIAAAATIGLSAIAVPGKAEAHSNGWWIPGAIIGGLAIGAIASRPYYYGPGPYYGYGYDPYYYGGGPYYYGAPYYARPYRYHRYYRYRRYYRHY